MLKKLKKLKVEKSEASQIPVRAFKRKKT